MEIFKILMATRYNRCTIEYVRALNSIDVVFMIVRKCEKHGVTIILYCKILLQIPI